MGDVFLDEKDGLVPSTKWKKNNLGRGWVLGETLITGIGQGYIQTTPLQLCLMTAQLANGGYKIYPKIIVEDKKYNQSSSRDRRLRTESDQTKKMFTCRLRARGAHRRRRRSQKTQEGHGHP